MKENQKQEDLSVRWDKSLSKKRIALFHFPNRDENELRLVTGDELKLKLVTIYLFKHHVSIHDPSFITSGRFSSEAK